MPIPTPGPWTNFHIKRRMMVCDANGNFIARIMPVKRYGIAGDDQGNIALITAAPDALALARQVIEEVECYCDDHVAVPGPCAHCVAKDFISKATGVAP